jgi:hypothetical protein
VDIVFKVTCENQLTSKEISPAKAQRRKEEGAKTQEDFTKRGSALRLCAFAGEFFFLLTVVVSKDLRGDPFEHLIAIDEAGSQ